MSRGRSPTSCRTPSVWSLEPFVVSQDGRMGVMQVWAIDGIPEIVEGDDLAVIIGDRLAGNGALQDGDILVVTSKIVSKAEGRQVSASDREQAITDETVRLVASREHP